MRWNKRHDARILQQAWAKFVLGPEGWVQTKEHEWRDVPVDPDDKTYWSQDATPHQN